MSDRQDGIFSRSDFHWDRKRGAYVCPNGKLLKTSGTVHDGRTLLYRASKRDCDVCPIRAMHHGRCAQIPRDLHEDARDIARRKMKTKAFTKSRDERKRVADALRALEDTPRLRAVAAQGTFRRARRVSSRRHCAEPQNTCAPNPWAPNPTAHILCVKSLTIGSVQLSRKTAALIKKPHFSTASTDC